MNKQITTGLTALSMTVMLACAAFGQTAPATVSGSGTVTIERPAEIMRMTVDLTAKHKQLEGAIARLKEQKTKALAKLAELGAVAGRTKFSEPVIGQSADGSQAQMQRMIYMQMQMQNQGVDKDLLASLPVSVSIRLTAEWPLVADSPEDLLLLSHELQEKIKAADLAAADEAEELTPEEEELMEEMQDYNPYGGNRGQKPGEATFTYVFKISEEERANALKEAFAKAQAQAKRLAASAGLSAGPPVSIRGSGMSGAQSSQQQMYYQMMMGETGMNQSQPGEDEAAGPAVGKITFPVIVNASFELARR